MKVIVGALGLAVLVGVAVAAFVVWIPSTGSVALADMVNALRGVNTVHMTGQKQLAFRVDKWVRREPFAVYEENTPVNPKTDKEASMEYIVAGDSEKTYWYFPRRGNRVTIGRRLPGDFMSDVIAPLGGPPSPGAGPQLRRIGKSIIDGKRVVILSDAPGQKKRIELTVDTATKLTLRLRQFEEGPDGKSIETDRLRFEYNQPPPPGIFDWTPPAGATIVDKRRRPGPTP